MLSPILRRFAHFTFLACLALCSVARAEILVNLDATGLSPGPLATWTNTGTISSNFTSAGTVIPQVTNIAGARGVAFIGGTSGPEGTHYVGPVAPASITGTASSRTVEAWVYNPSAQAEETVFGWGRRGEPPGGNVSFNHGTHGTFGAVGHWGAPDIGWNGQIEFNRWTYIVYSWDSATQITTVYKDGQLANTESGVFLNTYATDTGGNPLRFRVARQNDEAGAASGVGVGEITIARVRVHDAVLDATTIAANFEAERVLFGLIDDDNDGLPNGYESRFPGCLSPTNPADAAADCDSDGLTNLDEFQRGTLPDNADSDSDGVNDGAEVNRMDGGSPAPTNPLRADSDDDNLLDGVETDTGTFVGRTDTGTDPLVSDSDGDGYLDGHEVVRDSNPTVVGSVPDLTNPTPLIYLDATTLPAGPLPVWTNSGALGGVFNASATVPSVITTRPDARGVNFNGTAHFYTGPAAPAFITGTNARTIEAWVFNPAIADEETIFSWARRGGPDGSNMSFNHGSNPTWGAVGHWGSPDVGWGTNTPIAGRWTFVAYAYNPETQTATVYRDGAVANIDNAGVLNTHGTDNTPATNRLPFRVASQNEPGGDPTPTLRGSMTIARIRVYEVTLDDLTITNHFAAEAEMFGVADNDGDGMLNGYERRYPFLDVNNPADAAMDHDNDGATNLEEYRAGSAPDIADTDGDTVKDGDELHRLDNGEPAPTNPLRADTDQDGLPDNVETDTGTIVNRENTGSDPLVVDSDGDSFADGQEVLHESDPNIGTSTPDFDFTPPLAIVNLDATALPTGALPQWTNSGALGGLFLANTNAIPAVELVEGARGVTFDGTTHIYTGPIAPIFLATNNSRTVEAWIYNPAIAPEENIFSWGRRGGPEGSNISFNHSTDPTWGAVGHWGAPDIGWNGNLSTNRWTFVAYTYDRASATVNVYRDGQLANTEVGITLGTHWRDNTPAANPLPFRVATQNEANGTATAGLRGSMTIARIRVYDEALAATGDDSIEAHYQAEVGTFSGLRISISYNRTANSATITWSAAAGASYTVQSSDNLASWSNRATGLTSGSFTDAQAGGMRFYRVLTE